MILVLVLILIVFALIEGMRIVFNPLTRTDDQIREKMLSQFPQGTQMDEVIKFANEKKGWSGIKVDYENGYSKYALRGEEIGEKHLSVYIGEYHIITNLYLHTAVQVFFSFNGNSELIDIRVRKMTDAP